jgi:hypothetical protein
VSATGGETKLDINSSPVSYVKVDGKPIGQTPKKGYAVEPGTHLVQFVIPDQDVKKEVSVTVKPGETVRVIQRLREE